MSLPPQAATLKDAFGSKEESKRKYSDIMETLTKTGRCRITCRLVEAPTISAGVKKEKVQWKKQDKWPKGKAIKIQLIDEPTKEGILFLMVEDTSINNL